MEIVEQINGPTDLLGLGGALIGVFAGFAYHIAKIFSAERKVKLIVRGMALCAYAGCLADGSLTLSREQRAQHAS